MNSGSSDQSNVDDADDQPMDDSACDPLEVPLAEFTEEIRLGKTPSVNDFAERYPELADQIRELFPLVGGLERWKSEKEEECLRKNIPKEFSFKQLGEYEIVRELGRGGMGVVFQAVHITSQRTVAIKVLPWRYAADMSFWKDRLLREATTIAALQHPNIVQIYSFSEDQGYSYYVMQFVEGIGLDTIIRQFKQQRAKRRYSLRHRSASPPNENALTFDSWRGFARIGEQVAQALVYAHGRNILHNDIKPSNLLMRSNGQVIVTDFGIGRLASSDEDESDDRAIGTLRYMAPERLTGTHSPQSDIYSLGVTLYELATQSPIFDVQKRSRLIAAIQGEEPPSPRKLISDFPLPFEKIILKAMAKAPKDRYVSARAFADDLRRFILRQPIHAAKQGIWQSTIDWCRGLTRHLLKKYRR